VEATEEALATGFGTGLVAEFVDESRYLSLEESGSANDRLCWRDARSDMELDVRCCQDIDFPTETLDLVLEHLPCTSLSALQAR